jgi:Zn-dependent carboxypeptidase
MTTLIASLYDRLEDRFRRLGALGDAEAMLHWDLATMMPKGGAAARAEQLATLKTLRHGLLTAPEVGDWLAAATAGNGDTLDAWQRANLREMRRVHAHATALDASLVEALSRATSACEATWRDARADDDFALVLPALKALLALVRETAAAKAEALDLSPYDALLDEYEPDGRSAEIDIIFADLAAFLPDFLARVLDAQADAPALVEPTGPFPIDRQRDLGVRFMELVGFDFDHGRLDVSLHPFCGGTPDDVRITTRYQEDDFRPALMGVMHETGHALYERGLPLAWRGQPVGNARGMAMHESQSLLIEMQVCRSREFLDFASPLVRDAFGGDGPAWGAANLYRHYTRVERGFIRVDADEVTYPAHVILRYELERAMIAGDLDPADLPGAWADGLRRLLGIVPPNDRLGCLQDIHWYDGAWGYFPTYTLGAMAAAQLFTAACEADADIRPGIARGDFAPLVAWLRANVHGQGCLLPTRDLLIRATGRPLTADAFKAHLARRYLA